MEFYGKSKIRYTKRWFCYFDLLGFSELVLNSSLDLVIPLYQKALIHLEDTNRDAKLRGISVSWFSDTFIIYTQGGRAEDFASIEHIGRIFFQHLIQNKIPIRGALSFGELYTQQEKNIFIGPALIDAYNYGEGQNWLGFLLTPSAVNRMDELSLPASKRFAYRPIPKDGVLRSSLDSNAFAFAFNNGLLNGTNVYLKVLNEMNDNVDDKRVSQKYKNTLRFIESAV